MVSGKSSRSWYGTADEHVVEIGFKSLKSDPCVYIYSGGGAIYMLTLCVDDVLLLGKDHRVLERIKRKLIGLFSATDIRDASLVLGMKITRDRTKGTVVISSTLCQGLAGAVRNVKLQPRIYTLCGKGIFAALAEKKAVKKRTSDVSRP